MTYQKFLNDHGNEAGVKLINGDTVTFITSQNGKQWAEYQQFLADGGVPEPADVPVKQIRYLTKRTIATRLKAIGKYEQAFGVVTASGKLQDWNDAQDIQADPPDAEVLQALQYAELTAEEIAQVLAV